MERLTVRRERLPNAAVGDSIAVLVHALVTKIETDVIDATGYDPTGSSSTYLPGETTIELLPMRVVER